MIETILALSLIGLPLFYFRQTEMTRRIPLIFVAGIVALYPLVTLKISLILDYPTIAMICFGLWLIASLSWTDSHQSEHEAYSLVSLLILGYLARFADYSVILGVILAVGTTFAIMSTYYILRGETNRSKIYYIFGNKTHNSTLNILPLFISMWAVVEISPLFLLYTAILGYDIYNKKTEGTNLGVIIGLIVAGILLFKWYMLLVLLLIPILVKPYKGIIKSKESAILVRLAYWKASWNMIKRRYLFGFGLNMFRKEFPNIIEARVKIEYGYEIETGHRPHNDLLDITLELGIIGLIIFCSIFIFIPWGSVNPILIGGFVAYMTAGMFFFPLREVHTSLPFWCFVGVLMGLGSISTVGLNPFIAVILGLIVLRVLYATSLKALALYFFECTQNGKYPNEEKENIKRAIGLDPYNSTYLMFGVLFHVEKEPEIAFEYAMRQVSHFDGGKVKWGAYDHLARVAMVFNGMGIAEFYTKKALYLNPDFKPSKELLGYIDELKENMVKPKEE